MPRLPVVEVLAVCPSDRYVMGSSGATSSLSRSQMATDESAPPDSRYLPSKRSTAMLLTPAP